MVVWTKKFLRCLSQCGLGFPLAAKWVPSDTTLFSSLNLRCWNQKSYAEECWWNSLNSNKLWILLSLCLTLSPAGLSSLDCYIINTWFQLTVANHVFKLLLTVPIQQEWVLTPFTHSSHGLSLHPRSTDSHKTYYPIKENFVLCALNQFERVDTSHSLYRLYFVEGICEQTR